MGGGNFFRARKQGVMWGMQQAPADTVGMLATVMNGLIWADLLTQAQVPTVVLSALSIPGLVQPISHETITHAQKNNNIIIFTGGTGNPYFTTDTAAVLRGLQMGAREIWKATGVDYIFDADPAQNPQAHPIKNISYHDFIEKKLGIMDLTAITMAQENNIIIRVFNIFTPQALFNAAHDKTIGSTISSL
jgi:uridylate kinase